MHKNSANSYYVISPYDVTRG